MTISVGQEAPDFKVMDHLGKEVTLSAFRGKKNVVLVFFPFAFSPTCTDELASIRDERAAIEQDDTIVFAMSCDSMWVHRVFAERDGYDFQLLSDSWPYGRVASDYGVFLPDRGIATRATFVIDKQGIVVWAVVNDLSQTRDVKQYCNAVADIPD